MKKFKKPTIVLSRCIEHENCRYNGSMVKNQFVKDLKDYVNFITVCPETGIGLPTPREALRIIQTEDGNEKLVFSRTGKDITKEMMDFTEKFLKTLKDKDIDGFLLKSSSPSCGVKDCKLYKTHGKAPCLQKKTNGLFTREVLKKFPYSVVEHEGRLTNFNIREHFLTRIYTLREFREVKFSKNLDELVNFHNNNKYLLMSCSPYQLKNLDKIIVNKKSKELENVFREYEINLHKVLRLMPKNERNINMLIHLLGFFSKDLSQKEKAFFLEILEKYNQKKVPFSAPLSVIKSWSVRFENEYLLNQTIFNPFPDALIEVRDSGKGL